MYVLNTKSPKYIKQVSSIKGKIDTEAGRVEGLGTHFQSWVIVESKNHHEIFTLNYTKPIAMHRSFHCLLLSTQALLYLSSAVCVCSTLGWLSAPSELSLATITSCYMSPALLMWS